MIDSHPQIPNSGFGGLWEDIQNPGSGRETPNDLCLAPCDDGGMDKHDTREPMAVSEEETQDNSVAFSNKDSSDSEFSDVEGSSDEGDTEDEEQEEEEEEEEEEGAEGTPW